MFSQVRYLEVCIYLSCVPVASYLELTCLQEKLSIHAYELLIRSVSVSPVQRIGRNPFLWTVLCNIRYQQPAGNHVYRVLQHMLLSSSFNVSPFHIPFHSPFHSSLPNTNYFLCTEINYFISGHNTRAWPPLIFGDPRNTLNAKITILKWSVCVHNV